MAAASTSAALAAVCAESGATRSADEGAAAEHVGPARARPIVVAHRGASACAPELTGAAFALAVAQGADYVEVDIGVSRDNALVCLHDDTLERTTDVAARFPSRGRPIPGSPGRVSWWLSDFTLAELRTLDAGSWRDARFARERLPTLDEAFEHVLGRAGLYIELKSAARYRSAGLDLPALVTAALDRHGSRSASAPIVLQSFDEVVLRTLLNRAPHLARTFLIEADEADAVFTAARITGLARWATGIGPAKAALTRRPDRVAMAHAAGLTVVPWTFSEHDGGGPGSLEAAFRHFLHDLGVDGVITDNPDRVPR